MIGIILKKLEDSELNPQKKENNENPENNEDQIKEPLLIEDTEKIDSQETIEAQKTDEDSIQKNGQENNSLFQRILENGFDGITSNPNYKLLALLIILLINLSLFFLIGNLGKSFLANSGLLS